ncbi:response regulator transcription factor [Amycolatopsis sp. SID8362]|uniref:response regulator transcription factor n=1 Tax=Amycolatopsis sp. SID8362 TaxID=2690346 RepID=UPI001369947A|nr:response regulator transcription factor [Amycolatopsis sp. SID8362]NBH10160.1 DNA-binding response regulator [Amycolatopsis sp. SID8362]NED46855.1 response regulator transcription factor [Amycolatopsis sp. SID8362]
MEMIDGFRGHAAQLHVASATRGTVRVLVVDAMPLVASGIRALVDDTSGLFWCGAVHTAQPVLAEIRRLSPHVVLVDSGRDPDARGVRTVLEARPGIRVIGLVREDLPTAVDYVHAARTARVTGLVSQSATPDVVLAAIRAVHSGHAFLDQQLAPLLSGAYAWEDVLRRTVGLTQRQHETLRLIACGLRNAEIGDLLGVSVETVRTHVKQIMLRLAAVDRAHAVARGYQRGLLGGPESHARQQLDRRLKVIVSARG